MPYLDKIELDGVLYDIKPSLTQQIKSILGVKDLLWENNNPDTAWAATTIQLDLSGYSEIIIDFEGNTTTSMGIMMESITMPVPMSRTAIYTHGGGAWWGYRWITITSTSIKIEGGNLITAYNTNTSSANNAVCVPYRIWGWNPPHLS